MLPTFYPHWMIEKFNFFEKEFKKEIFSTKNSLPEKFIEKALFPGRRTRPTLLLSFAEVLNISSIEIIKISFALEYFHRASIIIDDILDKEEKRRNFPVYHKFFNHNNAILISHYLVNEGINSLLNIEDINILKIWSNRYKQAIIGEFCDINTNQKTPYEYQEILNKTLGFFEFMGDTLAYYGCNENIKHIFKILGSSFQVSNDIFDFFSCVENTRQVEIERINFKGNYLYHRLKNEQLVDDDMSHLEIMNLVIRKWKTPELEASNYIEQRIAAVEKLDISYKIKEITTDFLRLLTIKEYWYHEYTEETI